AGLSAGGSLIGKGRAFSIAANEPSTVDTAAQFAYPPPLISARTSGARGGLYLWHRSLHREADLPAVPPRAQAPSRLPRPHGHQERPEGRRPPPRQGPQAADGLTLPRRAYARPTP